MAAQSLSFKVWKKAPELIPPARPTLYDLKELSEIDDQGCFRFQVPVIQFYPGRSVPTRNGQDPARVIKEAVAKALVWYYPFAGRLREKEGSKLFVECNGEGILFIEAYADVTLHHFGEQLGPPFPCFQELLYDVPGSTHVLGTPLVLIQVTKLKCGGFIVAFRINHTMADAAGVVQFINAIAELARGAQSPSIHPVWERHLLSARDPPRVTCDHREYDHETPIVPPDDMLQKSFFFGPTEIAALRRFIPPHLKCSRIQILTACLLRCRTIALQYNPEETVRVICLVNARNLFNPPLPSGYYGNVVAFPVALSTAGDLYDNPIDYAVNLVKKTKDVVSQEYMMSAADFMVLKGRPGLASNKAFVISDNTPFGYLKVDFGWGYPVFGGPATSGVAGIPGVTFYISYINNKGEKGIVVPMCLPKNAMEVFEKELNGLLCDAPNHPVFPTSSFPISSSL